MLVDLFYLRKGIKRSFFAVKDITMNPKNYYVGCIASHLKDQQKLKYFIACLDSIAKQTSKLDFCLVSWSCEKKFSANVKTELAKWKNYHTNTAQHVYLFRQSISKRSQFQHFKLLLKYTRALSSVRETWIIFSDDDDLWHPERVFSYRNAIERMNLVNQSFAVGKLIRDKVANRMTCDAGHVTKLLLCKELHTEIFHKDGLEYFQLCINARLFESFFLSPTPINVAYADRFFLWYDILHSEVKYVNVPSLNWMLYYRRITSGGSTDLADKYVDMTSNNKRYYRYARILGMPANGRLNSNVGKLENNIILHFSYLWYYNRDHLQFMMELQLMERSAVPLKSQTVVLQLLSTIQSKEELQQNCQWSAYMRLAPHVYQWLCEKAIESIGSS